MRKPEVIARLKSGEFICSRTRYSHGSRYVATYLTPVLHRIYGDDLHGNNFRGVAGQLRVHKKFLNGTELANDAVPTMNDGDIFEVYYTLK